MCNLHCTNTHTQNKNNDKQTNALWLGAALGPPQNASALAEGPEEQSKGPCGYPGPNGVQCLAQRHTKVSTNSGGLTTTPTLRCAMQGLLVSALLGSLIRVADTTRGAAATKRLSIYTQTPDRPPVAVTSDIEEKKDTQNKHTHTHKHILPYLCLERGLSYNRWGRHFVQRAMTWGHCLGNHGHLGAQNMAKHMGYVLCVFLLS